MLWFATCYVLQFTASCVFLFIDNCIFFVVHRGKGICPSFLKVCNGCVVHFVIGFDAHGPFFTFGLSIIGLGNVG